MHSLRPLLVLYLLFSAQEIHAQTPVWQPSPGHTQVPIWPGTPPDALPSVAPETGTSTVTNVSQPTMTVYPPKRGNTGVAMVVFPGGGYQVLAMDLEGTEICDWLNSKGITAILLKYRVPLKRAEAYSEPTPQALEDAQRTISLVRSRAGEWHIDPHKIGVIGFSAGGHMVAATSTLFDKRSYPAMDAVDQVSCRPDFGVACYPGHLWDSDNGLALNPGVPVSSKTPPTFLLQAEDDHVDHVEQSLTYYIALLRAGVPAEMHLYAEGGHAFGLRSTKLPISKWPKLVETWLNTIGMTSPK